MSEGSGIAYIVRVLQKADLPEAVRNEAIEALKADRFLDKRVRGLQYEAPEVGGATGRQLGLELIARYIAPVFERHNLDAEQGRNAHRRLDQALSKDIYEIVQKDLGEFGKAIGAEPKR